MTITDITTCRQCSRDHHDECSLGDDCGCAVCVLVREPPAGVKWEDPPANSRGGRGAVTLTTEQREALQARPKAWARIREFGSKSGAYAAAKVMREREPGFEFRGAKPEQTGSALYARFVGV